MNFKTLVPPLLSISLLLAPLIKISGKVSAQENADNWEYITDADDGTLYFAGDRVTVGKTTVIEIKAVNDPDEPSVSQYTFREAFNCETQQIKGDKGWERVPSETVAENWIGYACGIGGR
jgi:hypothetical protein